MLPPLHVAVAVPPGEVASRALAVLGARGRVTHVTDRRTLARVLAVHRAMDGVVATFCLPDGSPLDVIRRYSPRRRQGAAIVIVPETINKRALNAVAAAGAIPAMQPFGDDLLERMAANMFRFHFEEILCKGVAEAEAALAKTIRAWRRRLRLSKFDCVLLKTRAHGASPWQVAREFCRDDDFQGAASFLKDREAALVAAVDAESPFDMIDRLFREAFGAVGAPATPTAVASKPARPTNRSVH